MKNLKQILSFSFVLLTVFFLATSCADQADNNKMTTDSTGEDNSKNLNTRALKKKKVESKAYYYKSLASFKKGETNVDLSTLADLQGKQVNLVVLYDATAPWAEIFSEGEFSITGDDQLNGLMASYELEIIQQFALDAENEGIVMEPAATLENPIEAARELSMVDHVLMVEVKEVPAEAMETETADN